MSETAPIDTYYYDLLEVSPTASENEIKKGYMKMARKWHPDKNTENPNAEEKFKEVNEAYQILKDAEKRKRYDKVGRMKDGGADQQPDLRDLFRGLFGGGKFDHVFGDVDGFSLFSMMSDMPPTPDTTTTTVSTSDSSTTTPPPQMSDEAKQAKLKEIEENQKRIVEHLAGFLTDKLKSWLLGHIQEFEDTANGEAVDMSDFPGGGALLVHIGYLYEQEGKQHIGRYFGLQSFFCEVREKAHLLKETFSLISSVVKVHAAEEKMQKEGQNDELAIKMTSEGLSAIWKLGKLEIENIVRRVCEAVLQDPQVDKATCRRRAEGVERLGEIYTKVGLEAVKREREEMEKRKQEIESMANANNTNAGSETH